MILINHNFAVSANNNSQQIVNNKQKKSTFSTWWWTLIILACFVLAGPVFGIVGVLIQNIKRDNNFFNEVIEKKNWMGILICTVVFLIYGLFPSGCHFFWSRCFLKNKYIQAIAWLIAFWVLVGIFIVVVLVAWVYMLRSNPT
jgi:formate hydrogenlyase subunit 3/multisubunit Na+/H+ antiporter MnhD subunit